VVWLISWPSQDWPETRHTDLQSDDEKHAVPVERVEQLPPRNARLDAVLFVDAVDDLGKSVQNISQQNFSP
jgi:hypothetical protein